MIQKIRDLSSYWNVSGSEFELALHLKEQLKGYDVTLSAQNSVFVKKAFSTPNLLIVARLDVPGFILLDCRKDQFFYSFTEKKKNEQSKISVFSPDRKKITLQIDEKGVCFSKNNHLSIGDSVREQVFFHEENDFFSGKHISQYLIISFILSNIDKILSNKTAVLFYAQSHSNHKEILSYLNANDFTHTILLDSISSESKYPTILIKDRKAVIPYHLINQIRQTHSKSITYFVSDEKLTGAEEVLRSGVIPLPYLLPVSHLGGNDERIAKKSLEHFQNNFFGLIKQV